MHGSAEDTCTFLEPQVMKYTGVESLPRFVMTAMAGAAYRADLCC
jgi:hypothetical protein